MSSDAPAPTPALPAASPPVRRRGFGPVTLSWASSVLLLVVLVLANAAFARTTLRADLTEERIYSLSPATKAVLAKLSDVVTMKVYWDKEIPAGAVLAKRRLRGLLEEYEANAKGRVRIEWIDVATDEARKEAQERAVFKGQFTEKGAGKIQVVEAYHGLVLLYEDQTASVGPLVEIVDGITYQANASLEYDVTSALWKWSRTARPVVGIVKSAAPRDIMQQMHGGGGGDRFTLLTGPKLLGKEYGESLKPAVDLELPVAPEISVLVVLAPQELSEKKAYHLEQFVLRGGKALLLIDRIGIENASQGSPPKKTGLEDWLKAQGVEVPDAVVGDYAQSALGRIVLSDSRTGGHELSPYAYWPQLRAQFMDQSVPGTRGIDGVALYWPNEVRVDEAMQKAAGRKTTVLATTSPLGYLRSNLYGLLEIDSIEDPQPKDLSKRTLMAVIEGPFTSYWKGKPAPDEPPPVKKEEKKEERKDGEPAMDGVPAMTDEPPGSPPEPAMTPDPGMGPEPAMEGTPGVPGMEEPPAPPAEPAPMSDEKAGAKGPEGPEGDAAGAKDEKPARLDEGRGVLVVLGDAGLVGDEYAGGFIARFNGQGGFALLPNVVEWLTGSEDLISLRTRGVKSRKFDSVGEDKAKTIHWANYLAAPALLLMIGLMIFFVRRHRS